MKYAEISGWGSYAPPMIMSNEDISRVVDTNDEWIYSRSGIKRRHYSHVSTGKMAWLASERALSSGGFDAKALDLVILGSTSPEEYCPNTASWIKNELGAVKAAAFDLNSACTSWFYGLNVASDMIKRQVRLNQLWLSEQSEFRLLWIGTNVNLVSYLGMELVPSF